MTTYRFVENLPQGGIKGGSPAKDADRRVFEK